MIALILIPLGQCDEYHNRVALIIDILKGLLFAFVWFKVGVYFIIIYDEAFLILSTMTYLTLSTVRFISSLKYVPNVLHFVNSICYIVPTNSYI